MRPGNRLRQLTDSNTDITCQISLWLRPQDATPVAPATGLLPCLDLCAMCSGVKCFFLPTRTISPYA